MTIRSALATLLALLLLGAGVAAVLSYNASLAKAERLDQVEAELNTLRASVSQLSEEVARRAASDTAIRKDRADTEARLETTAREDSPAGDWLRARIPDGVREAYLAD